MKLTGFDIIEELGRGGMATVWKARQLSLDRIVAIKVLDTEWAADQDDVIRFQQEARAAARLKHGSIVQVYDFNVEEDIYYFVMEYVAGYTIGDWQRRKGKLSQKDALLVADSVSAALHYAWENAGIVHCDIKPDNVMIDADGTVKVADLGLARTIRAMRGASRACEEIMGTPQYISPEQASGIVDLDCRADIYSLGAMLYHLVTGKMPFEDYPEDSIIDLQISDTLKDATDLNPKLSRPMGWLLEKMLMKDRDLRQSDWQAVREDIQRVRKGRMPVGCKRLPKGASTMRRSSHRTHHEPIAPRDMRRRTRPRQSSDSSTGKVVGFMVTAVLVVILVVCFRNGLRSAGGGSGGGGQGSGDTGQTAPRGELLLKRAQEWAAAHPEDYDEAMRRFEHVVRNAKGSPSAVQARRQISLMSMKQDDHVTRVLAGLRDQVMTLVDSNLYDEAMALCEDYTGPVEDATAAGRQALLDELSVKLEAYEAELVVQAEKRAQRAHDARAALYNTLLSDGIEDARAFVEECLADSELVGMNEELTETGNALRDAMDERKRVLRSFAGLIGDSVVLELNDGKVECKIVGIDGARVEAEEDLGAAGATRPFYFTLEDIAPREMLKHMGATNTPPVALLKGRMAYEVKSWSYARRYFEMCEDVLRSNLLARVDAQEVGVRESMAERDLTRLMVGCGAQVVGYDEGEWLEAIDRLVILPERVGAIERSLATYKRTYEDSDFLDEASVAIAALEDVLARTCEDALRRERERDLPVDDPMVDGAGDGGRVPDGGNPGRPRTFTDEDFFSL